MLLSEWMSLLQASYVKIQVKLIAAFLWWKFNGHHMNIWDKVFKNGPS